MSLLVDRSAWQLGLASLLLVLFLAIDLPTPWSTPLYYELSSGMEPWFGTDGLDRALLHV